MHEMSLCESLLQVFEDEARRQHFGHVKTVWLEIGALSGVEPAALAFGYDVVCRGTLAEGSRLEIIETPGTAWCLQCAGEVAIDARHAPCPGCGGYQLQVTGGDEMRIRELEVA
ncbi:MAG: hydrogenase maturation nickel metallochaperone HypA [Gammaproteobacteria bacterium]|nr:hydrogenase maturation nickel metallochaperone HypA [Gammaproteobacteria bacterium]MCB1925275.1 hydrogenase maturation nickel metallochaperone HypA [Gammaproteobacteria bacterium]